MYPVMEREKEIEREREGGGPDEFIHTERVISPL